MSLLASCYNVLSKDKSKETPWAHVLPHSWSAAMNEGHHPKSKSQTTLCYQLPSLWWGAVSGETFSSFMSYFQWLSDQGQSSCTGIARHQTKPQRQSCAGFMDSKNPNTTIVLINIKNMFPPPTKIKSQTTIWYHLPSLWWGGALRKTPSPLTSSFWWLRHQGQSSGTVEAWHSTKPKRQSWVGFMN